MNIVTPPLGVFVYGTLKTGQPAFHLARAAGCTHAIPAKISGFDLFDLPFGWPAIVSGTGSVIGEILRFADLDAALMRLDDYEDVGTEFARVPVDAHPLDGGPAQRVWAYAYPSADMARQVGGILVTDGQWSARPDVPPFSPARRRPE